MSTRSGDVAISKTQRWLDLIAFLVRRHFPVPVDEVMEGVPAYREKLRSGSEQDLAALHRMFERDKDELRAAGIPIETREFPAEGGESSFGYQLSAKDFYLPYLRLVAAGEEGGEAPVSAARAPSGVSGLSRPLDLDLDDARAALDALHRIAALPSSPLAREARSALSKLTFDLEPAKLAEPPVVYAEGRGAEGVRASLEVLMDALRRRARVRFRYHGIARGEPTQRDVAPYGLLYQHGSWYLIGPDAARDGDLRIFKVARMDPPAMAKGSPGNEYQIDPGFDVRAYARREPWELGDAEPRSADVAFTFPVSLWADRNHKGELVEEAPGGTAVRRFAVRQPDAFLRWLQSFAGDAVVVAPPELRAAQVALARTTLERYARQPEQPPAAPGSPDPDARPGDAHGS